MSIQEVEDASERLNSYLNAQSIKVKDDEEYKKSFINFEEAVGFFNGIKYKKDLMVTEV